MKRVLLVSPHFPPVNAPDMQRVRLALPHLRGLGWEPTVLAVEPGLVEGGVREPRLEATYPADIRVIRSGGVSAGWTRWAGVGNLWWRCGRALAAAGAAELAARRYDAVLFSTTQFSAFGLGPVWREKFGVPYVLDYQDPWVNDYYARTGTRPPGGPLKYALSQAGAKRLEPGVLRGAAGVIAVSAAYAEMLGRLYPWFDPARVEVLPFGAAAADFAALEGYRPAAPLIDFADGNVHHVYTGRCGPDMAGALTIVFRALARFRREQPAAAARLRLHFIGTGYAPPPLGEDSVMPLARAEGVADQVHEHRYRVPYFDALHYLRQAHALMAVGSDDATYAASKVFPYVLAGRPLLLVYRRGSAVARFAAEVGAGFRADFDGPGDEDAVARVAREWYGGACERTVPVAPAAFAPYTAEVLTARLAKVLDAAATDGVRPA